MASNFFTRPAGLHPTPSACFPPPPPAKKGTITGIFSINPQTAAQGAIATVHLVAHNTEGPPGQHVDLLWTLPALSPDPPDHMADPGTIDFDAHRGFTTGSFVGKVKCTWPNGQVRTFTYLYEITPILPP